jgi:hypothetical protein
MQTCPHCGKTTISNWRKASMGVIRSTAIGTVNCSNCGTRLGVSRIGGALAIAPLLAFIAWSTFQPRPVNDTSYILEFLFVAVLTLYAQVRLVPLVELGSPKGGAA